MKRGRDHLPVMPQPIPNQEDRLLDLEVGDCMLWRGLFVKGLKAYTAESGREFSVKPNGGEAVIITRVS